MPMPDTALVLGSSGGLGAALADHLEGLGCRVTRRSRSVDGLDLLDEASLARSAEALSAQGASFDWIVDATGALAIDGVDPERALRDLDPVVMARSYAINAIGPALLFKHFSSLLPRGRPCVFVTLSARLASVGDNRLGGWMSYRASKAALNQLTRCAAIEIARKRPAAVVVALHPGTVPTALSEPYARGRYTAKPADAAAQMAAVVAGLRPEDTGGFFDYAGASIEW
jgi:NAD(P)-dependent dehydrogenase (short-subunit alcohol dehydrogenase family)